MRLNLLPLGLATILGFSMNRTADGQSPPPFLTSFGREVAFGNPIGPGEFTAPYALCIDANDDLYVVASVAQQIQKFSSDGTFLLSWGSGFGFSSSAPNGIAVGPAGTIFVADTLNNRIQEFDASGNPLNAWGTVGAGNGQFINPWDVAVSASRVYVTDLTFRVQYFDLGGNYQGQWSTVGGSPVAVAIDPGGDVFVTTNEPRVARFSPTGTLISEWGQQGTNDGDLQRPYRIAIDSVGSVYLSDDGAGLQRVQKFTPDGQFVWRMDFNDPAGLAFTQNGNLCVVDRVLIPSGYGHVQVYGTAPFSLAVDVTPVAAGDNLRLRTFAGEPSNLNLFFLVTVNGSPFVLSLLSAPLDGFGGWLLSATVPNDPSLPGLTLGFMSFSQDALGKVIATNVETVAFQ